MTESARHNDNASSSSDANVIGKQLVGGRRSIASKNKYTFRSNRKGSINSFPGGFQNQSRTVAKSKFYTADDSAEILRLAGLTEEKAYLSHSRESPSGERIASVSFIESTELRR